MGEIDRVASTIKSFFDSPEEKDIEKLTGIIERCIMLSASRIVAKKIEDDDIKNRVRDADSELKNLVKNLPEDKEELKKCFTDLMLKSITARRATYPLENPDRPWYPPTPEEATMDDTDSYTFAIIDSIADDLAKILPAEYQSAVEGDCSPESASSCED